MKKKQSSGSKTKTCRFFKILFWTYITLGLAFIVISLGSIFAPRCLGYGPMIYLSMFGSALLLFSYVTLLLILMGIFIFKALRKRTILATITIILLIMGIQQILGDEVYRGCSYTYTVVDTQ